MRFDIISYALGIVCFILIVFIFFFPMNLITAAFVIVLILFGLFFVASGYSTRPKKYRIATPVRPTETEKTKEPVQQSPAPKKPSTELTKIKGIGPKRIAQLNALQIMSVEDLAQFSAKGLATKLKISSKITAKWVKQAKTLLKEANA